jgi:hypothetical protein
MLAFAAESHIIATPYIAMQHSTLCREFEGFPDARDRCGRRLGLDRDRLICSAAPGCFASRKYSPDARITLALPALTFGEKLR